jgi:hypothetical protein
MICLARIRFRCLVLCLLLLCAGFTAARADAPQTAAPEAAAPGTPGGHAISTLDELAGADIGVLSGTICDELALKVLSSTASETAYTFDRDAEYPNRVQLRWHH